MLLAYVHTSGKSLFSYLLKPMAPAGLGTCAQGWPEAFGALARLLARQYAEFQHIDKQGCARARRCTCARTAA